MACCSLVNRLSLPQAGKMDEPCSIMQQTYGLVSKAITFLQSCKQNKRVFHYSWRINTAIHASANKRRLTQKLIADILNATVFLRLLHRKTRFRKRMVAFKKSTRKPRKSKDNQKIKIATQQGFKKLFKRFSKDRRKISNYKSRYVAINKFGNIKRAFFSPSTAISVHFLEKRKKNHRSSPWLRLSPRR